MSKKFLVHLASYLNSLTDEELEPLISGQDAAAHLKKVNPELYLEYKVYFDEYAKEKEFDDKYKIITLFD